MGPWVLAHPWMTFFLGMATISAIGRMLGPAPKVAAPSPTTGTPPMTLTAGVAALMPVMPRGNGVYHGLVRI